MDTIFEQTLPGARALLSRLPAALLATDSHQELCLAKEPRTISFERTKTDMVWCVSKINNYCNNVLCNIFLKIDITVNPTQFYCIVICMYSITTIISLLRRPSKWRFEIYESYVYLVRTKYILISNDINRSRLIKLMNLPTSFFSSYPV